MKESAASICGTIGCVFVLITWARSCDECRWSQKGQVQVGVNRGHRLEQCDGTRWVPYTAPLPLPGAP